MASFSSGKDRVGSSLNRTRDAEAREQDEAVVFPGMNLAKQCVLGMVMTQAVFTAFVEKVEACSCQLTSKAKLKITFPEMNDLETKQHLASQIREAIDFSKSFYTSEYIYKNDKGCVLEFPRRMHFNGDLVERFIIAQDDPRVDLRGQVGSRAKKYIKADTLLGIYRGLMLKGEMTEGNLLNHPYMGWKGSLDKWNAEVTKYLLSVELSVKIPNTSKTRKVALDVSAFGYENPTSYINDPRIYPYTAKELPPDVLDGTHLFAENEEEEFHEVVDQPNVMLTRALICDFPFPFLVTSRPIQPGHELLLDYGYNYFHKDRQRADLLY